VQKLHQKNVIVALLVIFTFIVLIGFSLVLRNKITQSRQPIPVTLDTTFANEFVTTHAPSAEIGVEASIIAEKVNLQRKLLVPESPQDRAAIESIVKQAGGTVIESGANSVVVELPKENESQITQELQQAELVESAEVDYPVFLTADQVDWGVEKMQVPPVWPTTQGGGVRVAIIDTGIDYSHPDLQGRYVGGYDFVNNDSDPRDDHGHGTHVAGVVAANANGSGIQGAASQASLVGLKVLAADGTGYMSDIIDAVDWAMNQNVQVMNFSLGTTYHSPALETKLQEAQARGIFLVAAAGNTNGEALMYPAAYNSVISVSATDQNDNFASFSSVGAEVAAPGVAITSTVLNGGYASWSGTSMAAPHVSASVALMISNNQTNIRERLHDTALDLGSAGKDAYFGYGRVVAKPAVLGEDVLSPAITFLEPKHNSEVPAKVTIKLDVQDEFAVIDATLSANDTVLATWTESPYILEWDATEYLNQEVTLVAQAVDDSGNVGAAQLSIKVVGEVEPSPTQSPSPSASASAQPVSKKSNQRNDVRKDVNTPTPTSTPSQERRQNTYRAPQDLPPVTNINQRNPQPSLSQPSQPSQTESLSVEQPNSQSPSAPVQIPQTTQEHRPESPGSQSEGRGNRPEVKGVSTRAKEYRFLSEVRRWLGWQQYLFLFTLFN